MRDQASKRSYRVLIVDDNRAIHKDFCKILCSEEDGTELREMEAAFFGNEEVAPSKSLAYQLDFALQGKEAYYKVRDALDEDRPYALAFVDMRMPPGWDGLETIEHLWKVDPDLHIVICTAYSDHTWSEIVERLAREEQWLILKKPFDNVEVCQLAAALTRKWDWQKRSRTRMEDLEKTIEHRTAALDLEADNRRNLEESIRQKDAYLQAITDRVPDGIIIVDENGRIESANSAVTVIFGYEPDEVCGRRLSDLLQCAASDRQQEYRHEPISGRTTNSLNMPEELDGIRKDGTTMSIHLSVSEFISGGRKHFMAFVRNLARHPSSSGEPTRTESLESVGENGL